MSDPASQAPRRQNLRPTQAAAKLGISLPSFWRLVRNDPDFPQTIKLSQRVTIVDDGELDAYVQRKRAAA